MFYPSNSKLTKALVKNRFDKGPKPGPSLCPGSVVTREVQSSSAQLLPQTSRQADGQREEQSRLGGLTPHTQLHCPHTTAAPHSGSYLGSQNGHGLLGAGAEGFKTDTACSAHATAPSLS